MYIKKKYLFFSFLAAHSMHTVTMETVNAHQASFAQHMKEIADHQALHGYKEVRPREQIDDERTFHAYACIALFSCSLCSTPEELAQWKKSQNKLKIWYHNQSFGFGFEDTPAPT